MPDRLQQLYDQFTTAVISTPWFYWFLGVIGLLLILFILIRLTRKKGLKVYRDDSGSAMISKKALRDLVQLACSNVDTPKKPSIRIKPHRGRLDLFLKVKLYEGQRLSLLREEIKTGIRRTFEDDHGIRVGDITVMVIGFKKGGPYVKPASQQPSDADLDSGKVEDDGSASAEQPTLVATSSTPILESQPEEEELPSDSEPQKRSMFTWGKKPEGEESSVSSDGLEDKEDKGLLDSEKK